MIRPKPPPKSFELHALSDFGLGVIEVHLLTVEPIA